MKTRREFLGQVAGAVGVAVVGGTVASGAMTGGVVVPAARKRLDVEQVIRDHMMVGGSEAMDRAFIEWDPNDLPHYNFSSWLHGQHAPETGE